MSERDASSFESSLEPKFVGLEEDSAGQAIVLEELRLFRTVEKTIARSKQESSSLRDAKRADDEHLLALREVVAAAKPDDLPALFEQMHHVGALRSQRGKGGAQGTIDLKSPYFAHVRLEESGKRGDVLIGASSYLDTDAGIRIVDWRHAPVSRIYYRYQEGDDYEESFGDRLVEGTVLLRRAVSIVEGELVRVAGPQGIYVRDTAGCWHKASARPARLQSARGIAPDPLEKSRGSTLPEEKLLPAIASMLDRSQFDLITRPDSGLLAIQGGAGSGKTTVGLHRIAYLATTQPRKFLPQRMLVVVPNEALIHYVGRVLPSLGVHGVQIATFARWGRRLVLQLFPKLPSKISDKTPPAVIRAKTDARMLSAIDAYVRRLEIAVDARVQEGMRGWPESLRVLDAWRSLSRDMPLGERIAVLSEWGKTGKSARISDNLGKLPDVTSQALENVCTEVRQKSRSISSVWEELLTDKGLLEEAFEGAKGFGPWQIKQVHDWCTKKAFVRAEKDHEDEEPTIDAEDFAILLRLWQRIRGPLSKESGDRIELAHLFVDEVQDCSPVELSVLLGLVGSSMSVTLAGDTAQRMLEDGDERGEFDWKQLLEALGVKHEEMDPLRVGYRSTAEITSFARGVLGPFAHEAEPVADRHGPEVEVFSFGSVGESVAFLADALKQFASSDSSANIAIVARFSEQAGVFAEGLAQAEVPNVRWITHHDFSWGPGVELTDVRQTKGLEFDEVILIETTKESYPDTPAARHALYVGATRAAHQLWCVASGPVSPVIEQALNHRNA